MAEWTVKKQENCLIYEGAFAIYAPGGSLLRKVKGRIVECARLPTDVYLYNPPQQLRRHPKGSCMQLLSPDSVWFKLHWQRAPADFDTSRAYVEQILSEALLGKT